MRNRKRTDSIKHQERAREVLKTGMLHKIWRRAREFAPADPSFILRMIWGRLSFSPSKTGAPRGTIEHPKVCFCRERAVLAEWGQHALHEGIVATGPEIITAKRDHVVWMVTPVGGIVAKNV